MSFKEQGIPGSDLCFNCIVPLDVVGVSGFKKEKRQRSNQGRVGFQYELLDQSSGVEWGENERFVLFSWRQS